MSVHIVLVSILNKIQYITKDFKKIQDKSGKKMLQFTFVLKIEHIFGEHGIAIEHCLAFKKGGKLVWNCPLNYFKGGMGRKQLHSLPMGTYNGILNSLNESKYISYIDDPLEEIITDESMVEVEIDEGLD